MIPKVIHYCWFGHNPKPELIEKCIASWRKYCPDYKIIEWNEDNYDVNCCEYTRQAYIAEKWAFVSDQARLQVVYEHGGIYMDTDIELQKSIDDFLQYDAWFAQDDIRYINTGLGFGAVKGHDLIRELLIQRINRPFDLTICNAIDTPIIRDYLKFPHSKNSQTLKNTHIIGMDDLGTYLRHHESNSWKTSEERSFSNGRKNRFWNIKCFLRNPTITNFLEKNGETCLSKTYVFLAYDLLDFGPGYYAKRIWNKLFRKSP